MNKVTLTALAAVVVLGVVVAFLTTRPETEEPAPLSVPALKMAEKAAAGAEEEEEGARDALGPVDRIVVEREGQKVTLVAAGEESWRITEPIEAFAEPWKVKGMVRAFKEKATSSFALTVAPEGLATYGLDEASRIRVTLYRGDEKLVDLYLGRVDKKAGEMGEEGDTLVMLPDGDTVYRLKGRDLRQPFDVPLSELRDKKLFDFKKEDVVKVVIEDPRDGAHPKVVLQRKATEEKKEGEKKGPEEKGQWELVEPTGVTIENLDGYATSLANARAEEFMGELPGADRTALDKPYRVTATVKRGDKEEVVALEVGAGRKKGVYARVSGRDGVVLLPKYSADQLLKGLNDLREKKLFAVEAGDIEEIEIAAAGSPRILLRRSGEEWTFVEPAGEVASKSAVKTLTSSLASFRVAEFLPAAPKVEETGLDATATRIAFKTRAGAGGASFALLLGKEYKSGKDAERVYGMLQGGAEVFSVMKYSSKNVVKTVDDLKDKRLFRVEEGDITELTIAHPDQTLTFVRQPDGKWKMTAPKELAAVTLAPTVSTLASLDVEKVTEKKPEEAGLAKEAITLTFKLKDGSSHAVTVSEEVADNANFALTTTEARLAGKVFTIGKYKVQNLTRKLPDFEKKKEQE